MRSLPSYQTCPDVALIRLSSSRPVVVLPQPDSPTRPSVSCELQVERDVADRVHVADPAPDQARASAPGSA